MKGIYCEDCNKQLKVSLFYSPVYDDGGGLDSFDVDEHVESCDCESAVKARRQPTQHETDDLPF
jgi:hypothetical protein